MSDEIKGMSRRRMLECALWAGAGVLWTVSGGVPRSALLGTAQAADMGAELMFVQISDSHIGFNKPANPDASATFKALLDRVAAMNPRPAFMLHTGDVSHLSRDSEWDAAWQLIKETGIETHFIPGEHDMLVDEGRPFFARFAPQAQPGGWYSFDRNGVHFVALVNVAMLKPGGEGSLGAAQLAWLEADLRGRSASQPVVVMIHIPLWQVYPQWGWGTEDGAQALAYLKRFGSVTVLNGHIHQLLQKVEGNVTFHTGMSTAFPQPTPGSAPSPGPMKVEPGRLRQLLGVSTVSYVAGREGLAIVDQPLGA
ncbi:MAG: metallophosphoesterase family protein [Stellaceae bacterium]